MRSFLGLLFLANFLVLKPNQGFSNEFLPIDEVVSNGAAAEYVALRCSGLLVSVLALDLPPGLESLKPILEGMLSVFLQTSFDLVASSEGVTDTAANEKVGRDVRKFAGEYVDEWNSSYIRTGSYLNELFDKDFAACRRLIE